MQLSILGAHTSASFIHLWALYFGATLLLEGAWMKLHSFHLMPYSDLPEDFKEKYRSVWVDVPSHLFDPAKAHDMYTDYLDELEYAAEMGFDGICVNEHHQNAYGMMPSPNLMAAAMARNTKDVGI